jgi:hypothetical protein
MRKTPTHRNARGNRSNLCGLSFDIYFGLFQVRDQQSLVRGQIVGEVGPRGQNGRAKSRLSAINRELNLPALELLAPD